VRQRYLRVAIVIATGLLELEPSVTLGPGVVGYLVKPFKREQMGKLLTRALETAAELQAQPRRQELDLDAFDGDIVEGTVVSRE
jgi:response regulator of citrate/malate metabolism